MATYTLSGSGTQTLSAGVTALHVTISSLPEGAGSGGASPLDYYGIGTLRPGNATAFWEPFTICGGPQWMPVPYGSTRLGYALAQNAEASVAEVFTAPPLAWPLSTLPDVAIASPANTQVLTYQSSSSKWINAAAPSGGTSTAFGQYRCAARRNAAVSIANNVTQIFNFDTSITDNDSMLQIGGAKPNRVTIVHAGLYLVLFAVHTVTGSGTGAAAVAKNQELPNTFPTALDSAGSYVGAPNGWTVQNFVAGDYISLYFYMGFNSGTCTGRIYVQSLF